MLVWITAGAKYRLSERVKNCVRDSRERAGGWGFLNAAEEKREADENMFYAFVKFHLIVNLLLFSMSRLVVWC